MNNLHRELAPITGAAWSQIEDEARRTFKRHIAGRRVVDVSGPHGTDFSAVGLGHMITPPGTVLERRKDRGRWCVRVWYLGGGR
jgi:uncharacterized linocin/CFP29 family protein